MRAFWENLKLVTEIFVIIAGGCLVAVGVPIGFTILFILFDDVLGLPTSVTVAIYLVVVIVAMAVAKTIFDREA